MWGWLLPKLAPLAPKLGVPPIAVKIAQWAAARSDYLKPKIERWQKLFPGGGTFSGPAVEKVIDAYEPNAYDIAAWCKKEEKFLSARIGRWRALLSRMKNKPFNGAATKAFIERFEPIAFEAAELHVDHDVPLLRAAYLAWMNSAGPRWNEF